MRNFFKSYFKRQEGATSVEFALISVAFISMLFATIEIGVYLFTWNSVQYSLEQATRYALVNEDATVEEVREYAISQMPSVLINSNDLQIQISYSTSSDIDFIELTGNYAYQVFGLVLPNGFSPSDDISVNVRMPVL